MDWIFNPALNYLYSAVLGSLDAVTRAIGRALLVTPQVTDLPQVQALTGRSVLIADTVFGLFFLAAAALTMVSGGDETARYTAKDLFPRCVVGFVCAHFSQLLCGQAITVGNALTAALADDHLFDGLGSGALRSHLETAGANPGGVLLMTVLVGLIVVLLVATAVSMITRVGLLLVLTAAAPLALACHALPQTDPIARMWWRSFTGCLVIPILQSFTLTAGHWMLIDPLHILPEVPIAGADGTMWNLLVVVVLLWTTVRIPSLVRRYATAGGGGSNPTATVVRTLVIRRVAQGVL